LKVADLSRRADKLQLDRVVSKLACLCGVFALTGLAQTLAHLLFRDLDLDGLAFIVEHLDRLAVYVACHHLFHVNQFLQLGDFILNPTDGAHLGLNLTLAIKKQVFDHLVQVQVLIVLLIQYGTYLLEVKPSGSKGDAVVTDDFLQFFVVHLIWVQFQYVGGNLNAFLWDAQFERPSPPDCSIFLFIVLTLRLSNLNSLGNLVEGFVLTAVVE